MDQTTKQRAVLGTYYFSECANLISADINDATVTEADFDEIEAFANGLVAV